MWSRLASGALLDDRSKEFPCGGNSDSETVPCFLVCDSIPDCANGADEHPDMCAKSSSLVVECDGSEDITTSGEIPRSLNFYTWISTVNTRSCRKVKTDVHSL